MKSACTLWHHFWACHNTTVGGEAQSGCQAQSCCRAPAPLTIRRQQPEGVMWGIDAADSTLNPCLLHPSSPPSPRCSLGTLRRLDETQDITAGPRGEGPTEGKGCKWLHQQPCRSVGEGEGRGAEGSSGNNSADEEYWAGTVKPYLKTLSSSFLVKQFQLKTPKC